MLDGHGAGAGAAPPDAEPGAPRAAVAALRETIGIKDFSQAPIGRALCGICGAAIGKGEFRFDFRFKESRTIADQRRVHVRCMARLPLSSRAADVAFVHGRLSDPSLSDLAQRALREALVLLQPSRQPSRSGASGSGGS